MNPLTVTDAIYRTQHPRAALQALAGSLSECFPLQATAWVDSDGRVRERWPEDAMLPPGLAMWAANATEMATVMPLADAEALLIPLQNGTGALTLVGPSGGCAALQPLAMPAAAAFERVLGWHQRVRAAEAERDEMRQRAEESEALHVLGLAANRSLDPDEVLSLVARFTRTLLGAHYVTVSTSEEDRIVTMASVGLRAEDPVVDDPFARCAVEAGKPIVAGPGGSLPVESLPVHAQEEMQVGLGVPLSLFGQTFGALVIGYRRSYEITPRDTRLALTLAGHAAVAISNARLHRALADRSRELERAYEELRWSTQAKERFFASMSHELRTPLNAILGYQSLLLESVVGELAPAQRPFLENAHRATESLLLLVNDVLDLSKLEAGKMELVVRPIDIGQVVADSIATVGPIAEQKGIQLRLPSRYPPEAVETDGDRVRQILINLLSNAIKYTETGEVTLRVTCEQVADANAPSGWLRVQVSDTGPGIAEEDLERIFHEFEQVVGASSRGGTGLGLPISRKLARLLGGDLTVESQLGIGSTFTLHLPYPQLTDGGTEIARSFLHG